MYMNICVEVAQMSHAQRSKVGAILVKDNNIMSFGYNGTPSGSNNCCEVDNVTKPDVLHAESNAICKMAQSTNSSQGATLYVTLSPCFECAKLIIQSGIKRVVFKEKYRDTSSIIFLQDNNVKVEQI